MHEDLGTRVEAPPIEPGQLPLLVVEDSPDDLLTYRRALARTPFQVVPATSVMAARQLVQAVQPAAVVLDINLHGRDAWDLLIELKRDAETSAVPVLVVATVDDRRKALGLGADAFARKPVDRAWLLRTLDTLVPASRPVRVLVIDDEEAFRFVLREMLAGPPYEVLEASSGREALALAREFRPDVLLLDLKLPDLPGRDVAAALAADRETADIPVLVVTSEPLPAGAGATLQAAAVIQKADVTREGLRATIHDALSAHPMRPRVAG
jgi:CheY-like chemotaxis protein